MLKFILGYSTFLIGLLFFIKPSWLRKRMGRKGNRRIHWTLYGLLFLMWVNGIGLMSHYETRLVHIIALVVLILVSGYALAAKKVLSAKLLDFLAALPDHTFRIIALVMVISGLWLINHVS